MINFKNGLKYLPRFRIEYTPYGPELVYQNYLNFESTLMQFILVIQILNYQIHGELLQIFGM